MKEQNKTAANKKMNWIFAGVILVLALGLVAWGLLSRKGDAELCAFLTYQAKDGTTKEMTIPLDEDKTYDVQTYNQEVHIQVKDGAAAFVASPCNDHVCESFGWLKDKNAFAMCAPNQAFLEIADPSEK